jgi:hypothetical protein
MDPQPNPPSKSFTDSIMGFARWKVSYLDALVPITRQVSDLARLRVSLQPLHPMDPRIRSFYARNLVLYILVICFALIFLLQSFLSLLPPIVASIVCLIVPGSGLFLEKGDHSVMILYLLWCFSWILSFPSCVSLPNVRITDLHTNQLFYSAPTFTFDSILTFRTLLLFVIALPFSDYAYMYLINNPNAELGNFAYFHLAVRDGLLGVVTLLMHFVNGLQFGGTLTYGFLVVIRQWIKGSGEIKSSEAIQASDAPPPYSVSLQATRFNIIVVDFMACRDLIVEVSYRGEEALTDQRLSAEHCNY